MMQRFAVLLLGVGFAGALLISAANNSTGATRAALTSLAGLVLILCGVTILAKREALVKGAVDAYNRSPRAIHRMYDLYVRVFRFRNYETYSAFNTILGGLFCCALGTLIIAAGIYWSR
jgi:hypothetical protein